MSYGQRNSNITMIEELPDLEQLEGVGEERLQKYIRNHQPPMQQSGMMAPPPPQFTAPLPMAPLPSPHVFASREVESHPPYMDYSCIDISKHIAHCPICSRFYNNDRTVYIIVIVVLSIMCLLLLKKVLNV